MGNDYGFVEYLSSPKTFLGDLERKAYIDNLLSQPNHGEIYATRDYGFRDYINNPASTLRSMLNTYRVNTTPEDKVVDMATGGLSFLSGLAPAIAGSRATSIAPKIVPNALRTFWSKAAKGLATEAAEDVAIDQINDKLLHTIANDAASIHDIHHIHRSFRRP